MSEFKIKLTNVRLAFADIYEAKEFQGDGKPKFGATFLLPEDDEKQCERLEKLINKVAKDKWDDDIPKSVRFGKNKCLAQIGNDMDTVYDGFADMVAVKASNKTRPVLINKDKSPVAEADGVIYSGCYVNAVFTLWAQDNKWGKRVNGSLSAIQFAKHGESFGGGAIDPNVADEFDDIDDDDDNEDDEMFD